MTEITNCNPLIVDNVVVGYTITANADDRDFELTIDFANCQLTVVDDSKDQCFVKVGDPYYTNLSAIKFVGSSINTNTKKIYIDVVEIIDRGDIKFVIDLSKCKNIDVWIATIAKYIDRVDSENYHEKLND